MEFALPVIILSIGVATLVFRKRLAESYLDRWGSRFARMGIGTDRLRRIDRASRLITGSIFVLVGLFGVISASLP